MSDGRVWSWPASVVGIVSILAASPAHGQATPPPERADPASVYEVRPVIDVAVIAGGALATGLPYLFASSLITPHCPCRADSVNAFDRPVIGNASDAADWISTVTVGLALAVPPATDFLLLANRRTLLEDVTVFTEALAVNGALVTAVKYAVQRPIPRVYSDPSLASSRRNYRSFYSGHTSVAFAALSAVSVTVDRRYGLTWQPWLLTVLLGGSVATERVLAGMHFYTDVLVGAAAGAAIGTGIAWAHVRERSRHRLQLLASRPPEGDGALVLLGGAF